MITVKRLPKETARAYERFIYWLNMGDKRSNGAVAKHFGVSRRMIETLASDWQWQARLRTWQLQEQERAVAADAEAKLEYAKERERRKAELEEDSWAIWLEIRKKIKEMLGFPTQVVTATDSTGKNFVVHPGKWDFGTVARLASVGDGIARLGLGMPIGRQEITGKDGEPLKNAVGPVNVRIRVLSDSESKKLIEEARPILRKED